ncbi:TolC family protein [Sinomicrobium weinanense]|uniref:TolC family protein n=1 Tax=Sinomicrobium weinanense TaxID=2842200 RepID=A0A926Q5C4_9FLAO|nr:TolC family protein [Sinomicrobium weinanense]MBC9797815.1 TolC family protein [Sinomicrobium weinanense]MBU3125964.1 TolC family protein [Sinomicrobium weinanense]
MEETLEMASQESLDAFKAKRQYGADYWRYRSFEARLLPHVDFEMEPLTYNRSFIQRYDPDNNIDVYRLQQNLNTFAQISVSQNIMATGAKIYLNSSFNRLVNYSESNIENYSTTPIRIGLNQPIMAFNELKWLNKTAEMEYEKAKKDFLYEQQQIYLRTLSMFFRWALAHTQVKIAVENKENAHRLYNIGKKRYDLGSIEKDELLNLELDDFTSTTNLNQVQQQLQEVISELNLYLNRDDLSEYTPELPEMVSHLKISVEEAREYASQNNPNLLNINIRKINAEKNLDQTIKDNRFDLSINASYGLNQQANTFADAYSHFLDQQIVAVQFSMPLLDWGERKGNIRVARMTKEVQDIEISQDENDIHRQLELKVSNFNLQEEQVMAALRAREISRESYKITEKRFLSGKVDLLRLSSAREAWQNASEQYIESLQNYWNYYYEVQQLTLYDFIHDSALSKNFDKLLEE